MWAEESRVQLKIDDIFSDQQILKMWISQSITPVRVGYVPSQQFEFRFYKAIHVLVEKQPGGMYGPGKFILVNLGFNGYNKYIFRYILKHLKRVYGL